MLTPEPITVKRLLDFFAGACDPETAAQIRARLSDPNSRESLLAREIIAAGQQADTDALPRFLLAAGSSLSIAPALSPTALPAPFASLGNPTISQATIAVAKYNTTIDRCPLICHHIIRPVDQRFSLRSAPGELHAATDPVRTQFLELPQASCTYTVLGLQPFGLWGYDHGLNEHRLVVAHTSLCPIIPDQSGGLLPTDLVRLLLERATDARAAVDLLADLVELNRSPHPLASLAAHQCASAFVIADPRDAFLIETAGQYWAAEEILDIRVLGNLPSIHQRWDRIGRGYAEDLYDQGLRPRDGTKCPFLPTLGISDPAEADITSRVERAAVFLKERRGRIDVPSMRQLVTDLDYASFELLQSELTSRPPGSFHEVPQTCAAGATASLIVDLASSQFPGPTMWYCPGRPAESVFFPVYLAGEIPAEFQCGDADGNRNNLWRDMQRLAVDLLSDPIQRAHIVEELHWLQVQLDTEAAAFANRAAAAPKAEIAALATSRMRHAIQEFQKLIRRGGEREVVLDR